MLSLKEFGVAFGDRIILDSITFDVPTPGCTVLLGPSGTGKSTLMRTLAGFNDASPSLRIWGEVKCHHPGCDQTRRPALVMQNSKLLVSNVLENLVCNLPGRSELMRYQQIERITPLLERLGHLDLLTKATHRVVECSLGEQRIIAILRAAISDSPLIMIDEPTAGLDKASATAVLALVDRLAEERGVLIVLHNLIEARCIARHIVLVASGRIQEQGPADNFFAEPQSESGRIFLATGSCPEISRHIEADEDETSESHPGEAPSLAPSPSTPPILPKVIPSQSMGPRGFLWVLPGKLAGTPWPGIVRETDEDLSALQAVGVTHLIALTEYPFDDKEAAAYGMRCTHSPMPDMHPPTEEQAWMLCELIDQLIDAGEVVAVHCRAGLGRTGTVLTAYWLWLARGKLSALKALEDMRRIEPLWVQSPRQVEFIEQFAASVCDRNPCLA
ncbi:MAG: ATP-binding cassette domain-containing protein [Rhodocyclales bacterium]|nr:ATP-binding cassette domain-containing protein [Rhodocyclales bacterium]